VKVFCLQYPPDQYDALLSTIPPNCNAVTCPQNSLTRLLMAVKLSLMDDCTSNIGVIQPEKTAQLPCSNVGKSLTGFCYTTSPHPSYILQQMDM